MIKQIKIGTEFVCIKKVKMKDNKKVVYKKGKIYKSEKTDCITNEEKQIEHYWNCYEFIKHFIQIKKN
jgi:hypothetical protein